MEIEDVIIRLLFLAAIVMIWIAYYFLVRLVADIPIWTVGGVLTLLGLIALAGIMMLFSAYVLIALCSS